MDCCSINGLDKMFSKSAARHDLKAYLKKGLDKRARLLVDFLRDQDLSGASLLEIGSGIGSLHLELIKAGAANAVGIDASPAYIEAATSLAERLNLQHSVEYHAGDFVEQAPGVEDADIVLLDRVICCYPHMETLVAASAQRARRFYALTYPRVTWWLRVGRRFVNAGMFLLRREFRVFLHSPQEVIATVASAGLMPIVQEVSGVWHVVVFRRQEAFSPAG